jgi:predicted Zn-dependent peptidase
MNKILLALSLVASAAAHAQLDRSIRPTAAPARTPTIAQYQKFQLQNGLTVLLVEDHKLPRLSLSLTMDVGQVLEGEKSGTVSLLGELLNEGTRPTPKRPSTKRLILSELV